MLLRKAVVVALGAAEMQLADRVDSEALRTQTVGPAVGLTTIGMRVVPGTDLVYMAPRGQRRPRRQLNSP